MTNKTFRIWRAILISGTVIGLAGIVGEMVWSADNGKLHRVEVIAMANSAKITIERAVELALGGVTGQVVEAELEKRGNTIVWNIEVLTTQDAIVRVYVDAVSGVVLTEEKAAEKRSG